MDPDFHQQRINHIRWRLDNLRRQVTTCLDEISDEIDSLGGDVGQVEPDENWRKRVADLITESKVKKGARNGKKA